MTNDHVFEGRRTILRSAGGLAALAAAPAFVGHAAAAEKDFKIGLFVPLSGPASLFGPTDRACAELAADQINAAGGIRGRKVVVIPADAGGPPAETAKSAVRLMLDEKVDLFVGSHDSASREALISTIRGKVPYVYATVQEGGDCSYNVYYLGVTPDQQAGPAIRWLSEQRKAKSFFIVGDDYVWPRKTNERAKKYIAQYGGNVIAEEYVPYGAPNKFEEMVTRIKSARPDAVLITLVGADNVSFNRTFAGFGLDRDIPRLALLLEENTLHGIGADASRNLYSCMDYFANLRNAANEKFRKAYFSKFGDKATQLSTMGADCYAGLHFASALFTATPESDAKALMKASEGLRFETAAGMATMHGRQVDKAMYLAECRGTEFEVLESFDNVSSGTACRS